MEREGLEDTWIYTCIYFRANAWKSKPGDMGWHTSTELPSIWLLGLSADTCGSLLRVSTTDSCFQPHPLTTFLVHHLYWPLLLQLFQKHVSHPRDPPSLRLSTSKYFLCLHKPLFSGFYHHGRLQTPSLVYTSATIFRSVSQGPAGCFDLGSPWMSRIPTVQNKQVFLLKFHSGSVHAPSH